MGTVNGLCAVYHRVARGVSWIKDGGDLTGGRAADGVVMVKPVPEVRPNAGHDLGPVTKQVRAKTSVPVQSATALISTTAVIRLKCLHLHRLLGA